MIWPFLLLGGLFVVLATKKRPDPAVVGRLPFASPIGVIRSKANTKDERGQVANLKPGIPYRFEGTTYIWPRSTTKLVIDRLMTSKLRAYDIVIKPDSTGQRSLIAFSFKATTPSAPPIGSVVRVEGDLTLTLHRASRLDGRAWNQ